MKKAATQAGSDQQRKVGFILPAKSPAKAHLSLQRQAAVSKQKADTDALFALVADHLHRQRHAQTTAELIDQIITRYPSCPAFASLMVDRLMTGDEALVDALRQEGV